MSTIDVTSGDSVVVDILFRELANAREQLHNSFDDADAYVDLVMRFKQKTASSTSKPDLSTAYLETLGQFNDGRIPGNSASSSLQVTRELTRLENLRISGFKNCGGGSHGRVFHNGSKSHRNLILLHLYPKILKHRVNSSCFKLY